MGELARIRTLGEQAAPTPDAYVAANSGNAAAHVQIATSPPPWAQELKASVDAMADAVTKGQAALKPSKEK